MLDQLKGWADMLVNAAPENRIYVLLISIIFGLLVSGTTIVTIMVSKLDTANNRIELLVNDNMSDNKSYNAGITFERRRNDSICDTKVKEVNDKYEQIKEEKYKAIEDELANLKSKARKLENETRQFKNSKRQDEKNNN